FRKSAFVLAKKSATLLLSRSCVSKGCGDGRLATGLHCNRFRSGDRYRANEKVKVGYSSRSGSNYGLGADGERFRRHRQHASPKTEIKITSQRKSACPQAHDAPGAQSFGAITLRAQPTSPALLRALHDEFF